MEQENVKINILPGADGKVAGEIIIRSGDAEQIKYDKPLKVAGALTTPFNYYIGRKADLDAIVNKCRLEINTAKGRMELHVNDKDKNGNTDVITGELVESPHLTDWGINTTKRWDVRTFIQFIRKSKYWFNVPSQADQLVRELMNWNGKVERLISDIQKDNRGNTLQMLETRVQEFELMENFSLSIPVFGGYAAETFSVELCIEPKSTAVELYLLSDQLHLLKTTLTGQYLNEELGKFDTNGFKCSTIWIN